jgi:hypothetical protein
MKYLATLLLAVEAVALATHAPANPILLAAVAALLLGLATLGLAAKRWRFHSNCLKKLSFLPHVFLGVVFLSAMPETRAAMTVVQKVGASSGGGNSATATLTSTTAGNLLVVAVWYHSLSALSLTISDNSSGGANTYTSVGEFATENTYGVGSQVYYAKNIKGGNTTVTVSSSVTLGFTVYEIAGADPIAPLDVHSNVNNHAASPSIQTATITPSAGDIVIATGTSGPPPTGVVSPFTFDYGVTLPDAGGGGAGGGSVHDIVSSGSSISATITESGGYNNDYGSVIAAFKLVSPAITLTSSQNPSLFGGAVTFTATVTGSVGTPTGTVTFKDGNAVLGTATLNASGVAYYGAGALTLGTHSITAVYSGDSNYSTSTSSALSQNNTGPNTITINNSGFETPALGSGGSFNTGTPSSWTGFSGSVGEYVPTTTQYPGGLPAADGSQLAYIAASSSFYQTLGVNLLANQTYVLTLVVGQRNDSGFPIGTPYAQLKAGSTPQTPVSAATNYPTAGTLSNWVLTFTAPASGGQVGQALQVLLGNALSTSSQPNFDNVALYYGLGSTTALASSQNPSLAGSAVTFTATVTGPGGTPTGTVVFMDGTNTLGIGTLNGSGVANFSTAALASTNSPHSITAVYGGDSTFAGSASSTLSQTVSGPNSITISNPGFELNSSGNPAAAGGFGVSTIPYGWQRYNAANPNTTGEWSPSTAPAQLTGYAGNNVGYIENSSQTGPTYLYQDVGSISQSGNYQLTLLVGNDKYGANQGNPIITLAKGASGSTPASGLTPITASSSSTPALTYGAMSTWTFNYTIPTGTDVFIELENNQGASVVSMDFDSLSLVGGTPTTTALTSSQNPSLPSQSVTFTATVTGTGSSFPTTGTVTFYDNGTNTLGTGTVNGSGVATFATSALSHATHSITAAYGGGGSYGGSISSSVSQVIDTPPAAGMQYLTTVMNTALHVSATTLAGLNYDADGDTLTITAVSGTSTNGPSGNVTLSGGDVNYTPANNFVGADQFTYTISDGYTGGTATCTNTVTVTLGKATSAFNSISGSSGTVNLRGYGIPGHQYDIQYATTLSNPTWTLLMTVTAATGSGVIVYTDNAGAGPRYYRFAVH